MPRVGKIVATVAATTAASASLILGFSTNAMATEDGSASPATVVVGGPYPDFYTCLGALAAWEAQTHDPNATCIDSGGQWFLLG